MAQTRIGRVGLQCGGAIPVQPNLPIPAIDYRKRGSLEPQWIIVPERPRPQERDDFTGKGIGSIAFSDDPGPDCLQRALLNCFVGRSTPLTAIEPPKCAANE